MPPRDLHVNATDVVAAGLSSVARRAMTRDVLRAVGSGAAAAASILLIVPALALSTPSVAGISVLSGVSTMLGMLLVRRRRWTRAEAATALERTRPDCRNVVVTAEELLRLPGATRTAVRDRVLADAAAAIRAVAPAQAVPLRGAALACAAAVVALAVTAASLSGGQASPVRRAAARLAERVLRTSPGDLRVSVTIAPPPYLESRAQHLEDPERIEAVAGSQLSVRIAGQDDQWSVRLGAVRLDTARADGAVTATAGLSESTYLAIEPGSGRTGASRLVPVIVIPDRAPTIVVERPGRDLLFPDSTATVPVSATAKDDFGMRSLELRFTKVSGSGEQFSFEEGVLALQLDRESAQSWSGRTALALAELKLNPGDSLVYRVVGADGRPGRAGTASSDTFFVEIAGPDRVTLAGFELPPDRDRYALSQQMIVLKIERLRARQQAMAREALAEEAASIAAEQRAVRANFVFLMGGHVEDEEQEAEHSHEIQEGRLAHSARREMNEAIQYMSRAEQALVAIDTGAALPPAKAAVEALQRAFGRNRYFMRTLPVRSRIDPSRRLAGDLDEAAGFRRAPEAPATSPSVAAARQLLIELLDLAPELREQAGGVAPARFTALAERALAVDAASPSWQQVSAALLRVRDALAGGAGAVAAASLKTAMDALQAEASRGAIPAVSSDDRNPALRGAWSQHRSP